MCLKKKGNKKHYLFVSIKKKNCTNWSSFSTYVYRELHTEKKVLCLSICYTIICAYNSFNCVKYKNNKIM